MKRFITDNQIDLTANYIKKNIIPYIILILFAFIYEVFFFIMSFLKYDIHTLRTSLYLIAYIFLMLLCIVTMIALLVYRKDYNKKKMAYIMNDVFYIGICLWGTFLSIIDLSFGASSTVMVYMTVLMTTSMLMNVRPILYICTTVVSFILLLTVSYLLSGNIQSLGFYTNLLIFVVTALFINRSIYKLHLNDHNLRKKLVDLINYDAHTKLFNRGYMNDFFENNANDIINGIVMLIDIDNFKKINDNYGHLIGDNCLVMIAEVLKKEFGQYVFRYGGDEYAIYANISALDASKKIDNINRFLEKECTLYEIHLSAGIYKVEENDNINDIFKNADEALYLAKKEGKKTSRIYQKENKNLD